MAFLHEEEDIHNHTDEKKEYGAEDRYSSEPQKAHLTGEMCFLWFVIVEKFGGHVLRHLASRLANVISQGSRQTKNLVLAIFLKFRTESFIIVALLYALYLGLVTSKQFNKGTFSSVI